MGLVAQILNVCKPVARLLKRFSTMNGKDKDRSIVQSMENNGTILFMQEWSHRSEQQHDIQPDGVE